MTEPRLQRVGAYAKLLANYASDDAIIDAGEKAELLFVRGLAFLATSDSDGYITDAQVVRYVGAGMPDAVKRARRLVEVGVWERVDGGYNVRSWLKLHKTAAQRGYERAKDRERKRAQTDPGFQTDSARIPDGIQEEGSPESLSCSYVSTKEETEQNTTQQSRALRDARKPRAARLPDGWLPDDTLIDWQRREGIPDTLARRELPRFRDYWSAQPGSKGTKADWPATWRNWLRRAWDENPPPGNPNGKATTKAQGWLDLGRQLSEGRTA